MHDSTNALTVITGWLERARASIDDPAQALRAIGRAERFARHARDAMRQALGAEVPETPPEPVAQLLRDVVDDLAWEASQRKVHLELRIEGVEGSLPEPASVWSVLTNLVLNAIAFSPAKGTVALVATTRDDEAVVDVVDEGPGVPSSLRAGLFDRGESRREGGAGVGLRHAAKVAQAVGGELSLLPTTEGSAFRLTWPLHRTDVNAEAIPIPGDIDGARILLLEDDTAVVELLEVALGARGATLTIARDALQLDVHLDEDDSYDILLVDLSPLTTQRGGVITEDEGLHRALVKARANNPNIGVVMISGSVKVAPRRDVAWVRKPFAPAELVAAIAKHRKRRP